MAGMVLQYQFLRVSDIDTALLVSKFKRYLINQRTTRMNFDPKQQVDKYFTVQTRQPCIAPWSQPQ